MSFFLPHFKPQNLNKQAWEISEMEGFLGVKLPPMQILVVQTISVIALNTFTVQ